MVVRRRCIIDHLVIVVVVVVVVVVLASTFATANGRRAKDGVSGGREGSSSLANDDDFDGDAVAVLATATLERVLSSWPDDATVENKDGEDEFTSPSSSPDFVRGNVVQNDGDEAVAREGGASMVDGDDGRTSETTVDEAAAEAVNNMATAEEGEKVEDDANVSYDGSDLVAWINDNGGLVHPNARIGLDPTGRYRGVFVRNVIDEGGTVEGIEEGDVIVRVPWYVPSSALF
jgi:hypothetical protein